MQTRSALNLQYRHMPVELEKVVCYLDSSISPASWVAFG